MEPEGEDDVGGRLVHLGQLVADLGLGHRRATWMQNIHYHLFPVGEQKREGMWRHCSGDVRFPFPRDVTENPAIA